MLNNQVNKIMEEPRERGRGGGEKRNKEKKREREEKNCANRTK